MMSWLVPLFACVALLYASVGFAGGSSYTALLILSGVDRNILPVISLGCNIIVAAGGLVRFTSEGAIPWRRAVPLLLISAPLAWWGASLPISQDLFQMLLGCALLLAALLLLLGSANQRQNTPTSHSSKVDTAALVIAAPLGFLSGLVGIGGGIFLAPLLHLMRWDTARSVAGTATLFIFVNSITGIAGQIGKLGIGEWPTLVAIWWPLFIAVVIGGQLGSHLGVRIFAEHIIRRVTGIVVAIAAIRLLMV